MIGLSLSFCVKDILAERVSMDDVSYIITSVRPVNGLEPTIKAYMRMYWEAYSEDKVRQILSKLDLRHPRLENDYHYPNIANGHWVNSEDEIVWQNECM